MRFFVFVRGTGAVRAAMREADLFDFLRADR